MSDDMANQMAIFQCKKNGSLTWICTMSDDMANQRGFQGDISVQKKWQPDLDSNQDKVNQNHLCYRYTIRLQILQHAFNIQRKFILSRAAFHFFQKKPQVLFNA